jgi:hypothetical protein
VVVHRPTGAARDAQGQGNKKHESHGRFSCLELCIDLGGEIFNPKTQLGSALVARGFIPSPQEECEAVEAQKFSGMFISKRNEKVVHMNNDYTQRA